MTTNLYQPFMTCLAKKQWERIGIHRRAGVTTPLFSIHSAASTGIGEFPDLKLLVDWCKVCSMSIIQLLPLNDVGFRFTPYDAQSTFALDPMYLSLKKLEGVAATVLKAERAALKKQFPAKGLRVNYEVKKEKLALLWKLFQKSEKVKSPAFEAYVEANKFWLEDFAVYKVIKDNRNEAGWEDWPWELRQKDTAVIEAFKKSEKQKVLFQKWLQWQIFVQLTEAKQYAESQGVLLMGDLPFLVSRDSADVWSHQDYFKMGLSAGAPPDLYFAKGQRWGMPPYHWDPIAARGYDYLLEKLRYAENFYDFFRIDHAVGVFRLWTIALSEPAESCGLRGEFDPADKNLWEDHGRRLLSLMVETTKMLPCAEDLGVIPECSYRVLAEMGIPGMDVQRWSRDWGKTYDFKTPDIYRINSIAVVSTHDMSALKGFWEFEVGTVDEILFRCVCETEGVHYDGVKDRLFDFQRSCHGRLRWRPEIRDVGTLLFVLRLPEDKAFNFIDMYKSSYDEKIKYLSFLGIKKDLSARLEGKTFSDFTRKVLLKAGTSSSIFSIQLLQDWLSCDPEFESDPWEFRINVPGTCNDKNWTLRMPWSLEEMLDKEINTEIKSINAKSKRI